MPLPDYLMALPALNIPFPDTQVEARAIRSDDALAVFFLFHTDFELPPHAHKGQWGTVIEGEVTLTVAGQTRTYTPGQSYDIPAGAEHSAKVKAGTIVIDVFEEADRYALKG